MKAKILVTLALLCSGFASAATLLSPAYAYTIYGTVGLKSIRSSTNGFFSYDVETNYFELQVKDCRWLIKLGTQRPDVYDYRVVSSDGSSTFQLLSYETRHKMELVAGRQGVNVAEGCVTSGNLPRFRLSPEAGAIWIAYASACHFAEDSYSHRRPVPFSDYISGYALQEGNPPAVETASWQVSGTPPHLPTMLAYSVEDPNDSPTQGSFTNVVYQAISYVAVNGLRFPRESTVSIYRQRVESGDKIIQLCQEMHIQGTNITSGVELESFKPKLPGTTVITEQRFNNGSGLSISYLSENNWPIEPVARNFEAYEEAKAELPGATAEHFLPIGTNAPDLSLPSLVGGSPKRLSDYKGSVVVLEFWATWCGPCQTAMAEFQTYAEKHPSWGNRVALIAVNLDDDQERAANKVVRNGWTKTENFWVSREAVGAYAFDGIPMVYIVDQRGKIAAAGHDLNIPSVIDVLLREKNQ